MSKKIYYIDMEIVKTVTIYFTSISCMLSVFAVIMIFTFTINELRKGGIHERCSNRKRMPYGYR